MIVQRKRTREEEKEPTSKEVCRKSKEKNEKVDFFAPIGFWLSNVPALITQNGYYHPIINERPYNRKTPHCVRRFFRQENISQEDFFLENAMPLSVALDMGFQKCPCCTSIFHIRWRTTKDNILSLVHLALIETIESGLIEPAIRHGSLPPLLIEVAYQIIPDDLKKMLFEGVPSVWRAGEKIEPIATVYRELYSKEE